MLTCIFIIIFFFVLFLLLKIMENPGRKVEKKLKETKEFYCADINNIFRFLSKINGVEKEQDLVQRYLSWDTYIFFLCRYLRGKGPIFKRHRKNWIIVRVPKYIVAYKQNKSSSLNNRKSHLSVFIETGKSFQFIGSNILYLTQVQQVRVDKQSTYSVHCDNSMTIQTDSLSEIPIMS